MSYPKSLEPVFILFFLFCICIRTYIVEVEWWRVVDVYAAGWGTTISHTESIQMNLQAQPLFGT